MRQGIFSFYLAFLRTRRGIHQVGIAFISHCKHSCLLLHFHKLYNGKDEGNYYCRETNKITGYEGCGAVLIYLLIRSKF